MTAHRHRAFTLIEVLAAMMLIAVFTIIASRLFIATMDTLEHVRDAGNAAADIHHVERALQADVWNAEKIACPETNRAEIELPGDRRVAWYCDDGEFTIDLHRRVTSAGREVRHDVFPHLGMNVRFTTDGTTLHLERGDDTLTCYSRLQQLRRTQP